MLFRESCDVDNIYLLYKQMAVYPLHAVDIVEPDKFHAQSPFSIALASLQKSTGLIICLNSPN